MGTTHGATPGDGTPEEFDHRPVLLHPLIENLQPQPGETAVDGTFGAGGVTAALAAAVDPGGRVIGVDRDPEAVERGRERFASTPSVDVVHGNFADLRAVVATCGVDGADVVTLDLGISSIQLDDPRRGFSFRFDSALDMRMDASGDEPTAREIVNEWDVEDLTDVIRVYGEERWAGPIARAIVKRRTQHPIDGTAELRDVVAGAIPRHLWPKRINPATKTFQALRIAVNRELEALEKGLQEAISLLRPGGRLGVIAFHSLEDTLVKNALHVAAADCLCPPQQPLCTCAHRASLRLPQRRAIKATDAEVDVNPRARSARLRIAIRLLE